MLSSSSSLGSLCITSSKSRWISRINRWLYPTRNGQFSSGNYSSRFKNFTFKLIDLSSTVIYAMNGISIIMPVENSMRNPSKLIGKPFVLLTAIASLSVVYFLSGFFGFLRFGNAVQGSVTLNLPTNDWTAITGQVMIGIAIFSNFGLMFFVSTEILFKLIAQRVSSSRNLREISIRTSILIVMGLIGILIPDVGIFVSLVGGFSSVALGFITPVVLETVFLQTNGGFGYLKWKLWKNTLLMMLSLVAMITATSLAVKNAFSRL